MIAVFIRTILIYLLLVGGMRLTGKRQIGELQLSELVTTLLLSEMAAFPLTNANIPILFCVIPILTILCLEIILSFLSTKSALMKRVLDGKPGIVIRRGVIDQKEMARLRLSMEDLLCALRLQGIAAPDEVDYAILEQNGQISVFPKDGQKTVVRTDMKLPAQDTGIAHTLVIDGHLLSYGLDGAGKTAAWAEQELKKRHVRRKDVFLMTVDDSGTVRIVRKEPK